MISYVCHDLDNSIIGEYSTFDEAFIAFKREHPYFLNKDIQHFIEEKEVIYDQCLPEYDGYIRYHHVKRNNGLMHFITKAPRQLVIRFLTQDVYICL